MKYLTHKRNIPIIAILLTLIAVILFFQTLRSYSSHKVKSQPLDKYEKYEHPIWGDQIYTSNFLHFSVYIPKDFIAEENYNTISLKKGEELITIDRIASMFDNLDEHISNYDSRRELIIKNQNNIRMSSYPAIVREQSFGTDNIKDHKIIFTYINGWVYTLSTSSPDLYDELNQIAQSFQYLPSDL